MRQGKYWCVVASVVFLCSILALLAHPPASDAAATITAASCSLTDVDAAINSTGGTPPGPAVDGDTVQIPAGAFSDCTGWTSALAVSNKSITIQGARPVPVATTLAEAQAIETLCNTGGQTTYTCISGSQVLLTWTTKATGNTPAGFSKLENMVFRTLDGSTGCSTYGAAGVNLAGVSRNVRVTGVGFIYGSGCGALLFNDAVGLTDHTTFLAHNALQHSFTVVRTTVTPGSQTYGDLSWSQPSSMGTVDNVFFEDDAFLTDVGGTGAFYTDASHGARVVVRFSRIADGSLQAHGTESGGRQRSVRHTEYYRDLFTWSLATISDVMAQRGGTGRFFDNVGTGSMTSMVAFNTYRANPGQARDAYYTWAYCRKQTVTITRSGATATVTSPLEHGVWSSGSYVDISGANQAEYNGTFAGLRIGSDTAPSTQFTYTVTGTPASPATGTITLRGTFDGNTDNTGYPCIDQMGRGQGDSITGEGPAGGGTIAPKAWPNQLLDPVYIWNNTNASVVKAGQPNAGNDVILEDRDYYNQNAACAGASCTAGIGRGTTLPTGCTVGTGYWKTNEGSWNTSTTETFSSTPGEDGVLYLCTSTNVWTLSYAPYTYPHPLQTGGVTPRRFTPGINLRGR